MDKLNLSQVEHASRYIGGEIGSRFKDLAAVGVHVALIFPDLYEIGMSSTGFQILYQIANDRPDTYAERAFSPWPDYQAELARSGLTLTSLETKTPLAKFNLLLFSIQYELACTNVVKMLDLAGLPRRAADRSEGHPILMAGGYCATNPEPWAPFFDALIVGDGEEVLGEICALMAEKKDSSRAEKIRALGGIEGVYLCRDYEPKYRDGCFDGFLIREGVRPARRRIVSDLNRTPDLTCPVLPNARLVHDRLSVEIMRGCARGCRFCQPGFVMRPVRERSVVNIMNIIEQGLEETGYDELTLLSFSSGDYSRLPDLLNDLGEMQKTRTLSVSLPSLRAESITGEMLAHVSKVRKSGFTIAPEAGIERLRQVLNKPITDEQILNACRVARDQGLDLVKLYFLIGLPTETPEDIEAIAELCYRVLAIMRQGRGKGQVNVNIGTFVPKPFTPFAWEPQIGLEEAKEKIHYLESRMRGTRIKIKAHDPAMSMVEGVLSRGDRRLADVIERVVDAGGGFDGWTDGFSLPRWMHAFEETGFDPNRILAGYPADAPLPWDGIDARLEKSFLLEERRAAYAGELTEDCRTGECFNCGACDQQEILNRLAPAPESVYSPPPKRKTSAPPVARWRIRYGKRSDLRFLGHLELVSIMHRALHRTGLDIAYSQGFHQKPRVAFGPPLSVGIESYDEYFDVLLNENASGADIKERLDRVFPPDLPVFEVRRIDFSTPSLFDSMTGFHFQAFLEDLPVKSREHENLVGALKEFGEKTQAGESLSIEVVRKGRSKTVNAKDFITDIKALPGDSISLKMRFLPTGSLNPLEALRFLFRFSTEDVERIRLVKMETYFAPVSAEKG